MRRSSKSAEVSKGLGVSVHYLSTVFLEEVKRMTKGSGSASASAASATTINDINNLLIKKKGKNVICPRDGKPGCAYVDCIEGDEDHVGRADVMISHAWNNSVDDIVSVLQAYCLENKYDPKSIYVWISCLCCNQHRFDNNSNGNTRTVDNAMSFEEVEEMLSDKIVEVGNVLSILSPWDKPLSLVSFVRRLAHFHTIHTLFYVEC